MFTQTTTLHLIVTTDVWRKLATCGMFKIVAVVEPIIMYAKYAELSPNMTRRNEI